MFVAVDGSTLLQAGIVTDLGRDGLHLRTRQPAPVGAVIEIEMDPRDGAAQSSPLIIRGRVVRVQELPEGEYSVGVKLRYRVGRPTPVPSSHPLPASRPTSVARAAKTRVVRLPAIDWRQGAFLAVLLLLVGIALLWPRQTPRRITTGSETRATSVSLPEAIAEQMRRPRNNTIAPPIERRAPRGYSVEPLVPARTSEAEEPDRVS